MTNGIFYLIVVIAILQVGCSQNSGSTKTCFSDHLPNKDTVLTRMSSNPHFKGGHDSLVHFMSTNIDFENLIGELSNTGIYRDTARTRFIVSKEGSLSDMSVTLVKNKKFADEIIRAIEKSSCNWVAGRSEQLANGWFQFDIYFSVEKSGKEVKTTMTLNEYVPTN